MDMYEIELESAEPDGFVVTVPAFPGLLILGTSLEEAFARARASIALRVRARDAWPLTEAIAWSRVQTGELRHSVAPASQPAREVESSHSAT